INSRIDTLIKILPFFIIYRFNVKLLISIVGEDAYLGTPFLSTKKRSYYFIQKL
ncbi:hypothetical protein QR685DRAFT_450473, partial [Neurospora intermedia]